MSLIAVKATIANHVADERPQEVRDALQIIEATSRTALTELRRTLGALRTDPDRAPAPGVAELPSLVEAATSAGIEVQLDVRGVADLPEGVGLAVFRIVQEALTNVVKHAGATRCRVTVAGAPDAIVIEVVDDGRGGDDSVGGGAAGGRAGDGSGAGGRGQGLIGMRERVALYGGELRAAPDPAGGWAVRARLDTAA
jgi:signal transduction histidine kinase